MQSFIVLWLGTCFSATINCFSSSIHHRHDQNHKRKEKRNQVRREFNFHKLNESNDVICMQKTFFCLFRCFLSEMHKNIVIQFNSNDHPLKDTIKPLFVKDQKPTDFATFLFFSVLFDGDQKPNENRLRFFFLGRAYTKKCGKRIKFKFVDLKAFSTGILSV